MTDLAKLKQANAARWCAAKVTRDASAVAHRLCQPAAKVRYQVIAQQTTVPWYVIAVIHEREASQSWAANLAQGDPWDRLSTHVPKDRGPFRSFEAAAVDALTACAPYAARWKDWTAGGAMTLLEQYNGLGYAGKGIPSPYIWAGTDQYVKGKYVADDRFDPEAVDKQLGCACILKAMMAIDPSITFGATPSRPSQPTPSPKPVPAPQPAPPAPTSTFAKVLAAILSLFFGSKK